MNFTKLQFNISVIGALLLAFSDIGPNRFSALIPLVLAMLTIRPLLALKIGYKIISAVLLVYFIAASIGLYEAGARHERRQSTKPAERALNHNPK